MKSLLTFLIVMLVITPSLAADPVYSAKAVKILRRAQQTANQLRSISYEATLLGEGLYAQRRPIIDGQVFAKRGADYLHHKVLIKGTNTAPQYFSVIPYHFACDGRTAYSVNDMTRLFVSGNAEDARSSERDALFLKYYMDGSAYEAELRSAGLTYVGIDRVEGTECFVVKVTYDPQGRSTAKFYLGTNDNLLYRTEKSMRISTRGLLGTSGESLLLFTAHDFKPNIEIDDAIFHLDPPPQYRKSRFKPVRKPAIQKSKRPKARARRRPTTKNRKLLASGSVAPDWTLTDGRGKSVSLKSLRGKVVVLDFWATWCGPCKRAMPTVQKIYETFKDKPVAIYGVNCMERTASVNTMKYIKKKGYTYGQLLRGDAVAVAYHIRAIPTFYVIGKDGKIVYSGSGVHPKMKETLSKKIEEAMK